MEPRTASSRELEHALETVLGCGERVLIASHQDQWVVMSYQHEETASGFEVVCEVEAQAGELGEFVEVAARW